MCEGSVLDIVISGWAGWPRIPADVGWSNSHLRTSDPPHAGTRFAPPGAATPKVSRISQQIHPPAGVGLAKSANPTPPLFTTASRGSCIIQHPLGNASPHKSTPKPPGSPCNVLQRSSETTSSHSGQTAWAARVAPVPKAKFPPSPSPERNNNTIPVIPNKPRVILAQKSAFQCVKNVTKRGIDV